MVRNSKDSDALAILQMEIRELTDQDHEVLGTEYCSGYTDIYGKWNTGFYCPSMGNGETVYCCGTVTNKYCCTRRDQQTSTGLSQAVILGSALGSLLVIVLVSVVSCLVCRRCIPYRRAHTSLSGGPLYSLQCGSTASGVTNMYSFSCQNSVATTPHEAMGNPHHVLMDLDPSRELSPSANTPQRPYATHRGFSMLPSDPPPPYNDNESQPLPQRLREAPVLHHTTTSFSAHSPTSPPLPSGAQGQQQQAPPTNNIINSQNAMYWSTKF